jgi:hypothetical protein
MARQGSTIESKVGEGCLEDKNLAEKQQVSRR